MFPIISFIILVFPTPLSPVTSTFLPRRSCSAAVAQVLKRQEKIHWLQLELEYRRAGFDIPKPVPRLSILEAWLNIAVGILLLVAGSSFVVMILKIPDLPGVRSMLPLASLILAGGAMLAILGTKALRVHALVHPPGPRQHRNYGCHGSHKNYGCHGIQEIPQ